MNNLLISENKSLRDLIGMLDSKKQDSSLIKKLSKQLKKEDPLEQKHAINVAYTLAKLDFGQELVLISFLMSLKEIPSFVKSGDYLQNVFQESSEIKKLIFSKKLSSEAYETIILTMAKDVRTIIYLLTDFFYYIDNYAVSKNELLLNLSEPFINISQKLGFPYIEFKIKNAYFKATDKESFLKVYSRYSKKIRKHKKKYIKILSKIKLKLLDLKMDFDLRGRIKSYYSINKKLNSKHKEINDLFGIRLICQNQSDVYIILGIICGLYNTDQTLFDDYIRNPKENKYQSVHVYIKEKDFLIEVQIRTKKMDYICEEGTASHLKYKELTENKYFDKKLILAKKIMQFQNSGINLFKNSAVEIKCHRLFVFTKDDDVVVLPENSTVLDFAFVVHTVLGLNFEKAYVNGKAAKKGQILKNADKVEVVASLTRRVTKEWLYFVNTDKAFLAIREYLGITEKIHSIEKENIIQDKEIIITTYSDSRILEEVINYLNTKEIIVDNANISYGSNDTMEIKLGVSETQNKEEIVQGLRVLKGVIAVI